MGAVFRASEPDLPLSANCEKFFSKKSSIRCGGFVFQCIKELLRLNFNISFNFPKYSYIYTRQNVKNDHTMRKILSLITVLVLCSVLAFSQGRVVTGTVRDEKGEPIPFASVAVKGSPTKGVSADASGNFRITVEDNAVLIVSGTGLQPKEIAVGGKSNLDVVINRGGNELSTVVVTALGIAKQPKELGYSVARIKNSELTQAKVVNLQNGLTGKVSGLNVATVNNGVFADTRITLRGIRSLTGNNQPLLVVDGVQMALGFLNSINPNDIADVNILKGNTGAALYGQDASNGVIIVTTKKGTRGKPIITVSHTTTLEKVAFLPKLQTRFGSGSSEDANGRGIYDPIENQCYGPEFDGSDVVIGRPLADGSQYRVSYVARPEEKLKFWNTGVTTQNDVSFSAGDERGTFFMSAQDAQVKGVVPKDQNRRTSFRFNSAREYGIFKASFNLTYSLQNYDVSTNDTYWEVINTPMHIPLTRFSNWQTDPWADPNGYFSDYYLNPYMGIDKERSRGRSDDFLGSLELNLKPWKWMNVTYRLGTTLSSASNKNQVGATFFSPYAKSLGKFTAGTDRTASVSDGESYSNRITSEVFATARKTIKKFSIDGLVGQSFIQRQTKGINISGANLVVPTLFNVTNRTGEPGVSESISKIRTLAVFGKVSFGWDNWAFVEFTGRNEWDSRLGKDNRSLFYPAGSVSFLLSEAISALKDNKVISYAKVRGSVAKSGNVNFGAYALESTYGVGGGFPYGSLPGFTASNTSLNPNLKPEFVLSKEVGLELGFFNNKINLEATAYTQSNTEQILNVNVSSATGFTGASVNAAEFTNKGLEFDLKLTPLIKLRNGLTIDLKGNFSIYDSKVTKVYEGLDELGVGNGNFAIVGYPAYTFKLTDYLRTPEGQVIVDATTGLPSADPNPKIYGRTLAKYIIGLNPTISYKGFTLSATADYRGGHQVYNGIGPDLDFTGISERSATNGRQRFVFPNSVYFDGTKYVPNTNITTISGGYGFWEQTAYNRNINSNYLTSAASWKLRELALNYELPSKVFGNGKVIKKATVGLVGRNLFMWLPKTNQWTDPEFNNTTGNATGVNNIGNTPPTRIFGGTVTLTF
jgi:TonB-linked SusC/RagA family outer membrane protein